VLEEVRQQVAKGYRTLITTLTKKMAEQLSDYMHDMGIKVRYLHSDVETLERIDIIRDLRLGVFDVLVGVNLLREGLDIPECGLVAILDADKEGFLRSKTSLIQTIGRAARNVEGKVLLYADRMTDSLIYALGETERRRAIQMAYNEKHGIIPKSTIRTISAAMNESTEEARADASWAKSSLRKSGMAPEWEMEKDKDKRIILLRDAMLKAASDLEFEQAARLRDEIEKLTA
jgi:excinuclease ABC subunit B